MSGRDGIREIVQRLAPRVHAEVARRVGEGGRPRRAAVLRAAVGAQMLADEGLDPEPVIGFAGWRTPEYHVSFDVGGEHLWLSCGEALVIDFSPGAWGWRHPVVLHWRGVPMPTPDKRLGHWRSVYRQREDGRAASDIDVLLERACTHPDQLMWEALGRKAPVETSASLAASVVRVTRGVVASAPSA